MVNNMKEKFDYNDEDFIGFLRELLDSSIYEQGNEHDKTFEGIAQRTIDNGWDSLSEKQQKVIKIRIEQICPERCSHCGDSIPWCEMLYAIENDDKCSHCVKIWEDIEKE